jgi:hypothetical protein
VALTSNGKTYYRPWRGSQQGTWGPGAWLLGCGRRGSRSGGTGGSIKGQVSEGKVACSEVYSAAFSGPRFPMVHLYLDRLFIVSCPPADEGRDYAGRSPFHYALDPAHGFLSLVLSHSTISGIKGGVRTCTELVSSGPTRTL